MKYVSLGLTRDRALYISGLTKHQYYHRPKKGKRGAKPSTTTVYKGVTVENAWVVTSIADIHKDPDLTYGYHKMTKALKIQGFEIGKHKVYRLMKENNLLQKKYKRKVIQHAQYRRVIPLSPYELIEMDIKFQWLENIRAHAYIFTIIDVFSRKVLKWHAGLSITQHTVADIWTEVITDYLQPLDLLKKGVNIEVRNDNDPRFKAKSVQQFFADNKLNQVFTHPYTPQENGHIESFHAILGRSLDQRLFFDLDDLAHHLTLFYEKYNNIRLHCSIASLPPNIYLDQWNLGNIILCVDTINRKVKTKLKIPYSLIQLSGNENWREASCTDSKPLDRVEKQNYLKVNDAITNQPSVHRSPSVASCNANL